ncbi:hypothetical protein LJR234_003457 [Mesorhizobium amorphae]|uniref:hypothetical protein n=1 Tax=Mesorhizobium amorphae TaxID=71433 RepID=UPI003ECDB347
MSVQLFGEGIVGATNAGHRRLAARAIVRAVSTFAGVAHKIADEVVYTIREDFRHGHTSRDPKDWER